VKRVLIPVHWLTDYGGLHENVLDTGAALAAAGWQVTVIAPASRAAAAFVAAGLGVVDDAMNNIAASTARALAAGPFDLVHAHPFQTRKLGVAVAEALGIPLVVTIHGQYDDDFAHYPARIRRVICVAPDVAANVAALNPGLADRLVIIPNGVDFAVFAPRAPSREKRPLTVAIASRLDPDKGILTQVVGELVDHLASGAHGGCVLGIAGERLYGPAANPFTAAIDRAAASGVVEVVRAGWISDRRALAQFFAGADVVVAPGRAAMEAVACEVPTIAAASRGYIGLVTGANLELAHRTNFGGVQSAATAYAPGAVIADFRRALAMPPNELAALRHGLQQLHDLRAVQAAQLSLAEALTG
jgi:glycosyltransferase involved in cell wall biosynthesis